MTEQIEKMDFVGVETEVLTPGKLLKQAREAKNLSYLDVAKQLRLKVQHVIDMENDFYQNVPALIYVRGYLHAYARLVNVSPDEVLHLFTALNFDEPFKEKKPVPVDDPFLEQPQKVFRGARPKKSALWQIMRVVTGLVVLTLVALVLFWWKGQVGNLNSTAKESQMILPLHAQSKELVVNPG